MTTARSFWIGERLLCRAEPSMSTSDEESLRLRKGKLFRSIDEGDTWTESKSKLTKLGHLQSRIRSR